MNRWSLLAAAFLLPLLAAPASAPRRGDLGDGIVADQLVLDCTLTMRFVALGRVMFVDYDAWDIVVDFGRQTLHGPGSAPVFGLTATAAAFAGRYEAGPDRRTIEVDRMTGRLLYSSSSLTDHRTGYGTCTPAPPPL